jgi:integrase
MTVNYYLDNRSNRKEKNIILYIRGFGKTIILNTKENIDPKQWDNTKQIAKRNYVGHPELNSLLSSIKEKVKSKIRLLSIEKDTITYGMIKDEIEKLFSLSRPFDEKKIVYESFNKFLKVKENGQRFRTIQKYKTLLDHLKSFESNKHYQISFENFNLEFYERFTSYLMKELKHSNNTIGKYVSTLKTFLQWTFDQKIHSNTDFHKFKSPNDKTDIMVLTEQELMNLHTLDLSKNKSLAKVRDVFCFQCFTGQRFSDLESLTWDDIKNDSWYLHTYKTKDIIEIPLSQFAKEILKRYKSEPKPLPIISHQKTNNNLKELCQMAEIDEPITLVRYRGAERIERREPKYNLVTTHTARRTFVTISLEKGMRPETIMEITGHTSYKTFKKYIKITSKVKHIEMNKFWKKPSNLKLVKSA